MGRLRRGGFTFVWWKGDHVHVYREWEFVVKWDLDNRKAMKGEASPALLDLLAALVAEGVL
jgi:hypothetical protein